MKCKKTFYFFFLVVNHNTNSNNKPQQKMSQIVAWIKKNFIVTIIASVALLSLWAKCTGTTVVALVQSTVGAQEGFSSCYRRRQIYMNSCDPDEPSGTADVNLENRFGKLHINVNANLPYAMGGVMHTMYGAYHVFLINSRTGNSINLGTLARSGDRMYKLSTELAGNYDDYDRLDIFRQTEDYAPKRILTGSITGQQCSSL